MHPLQKFSAECKTLTKKYGIQLEKPPKEIDADLALPCFQPAKEMKKNPQDIAKEIAKSISGKKHEGIKRIEASGPYVNFYADWDKISVMVIKQVLAEKKKYGSSMHKKRIMVEYSAPNSNKPLHVGHLRNDSIGMAISNILQFSGQKVIRANLVNDRGIHICKAMLAYRKWGKNKMPDKKPDHFVGDFYVLFEKNKSEELEREAQDTLLEWEKGDKEARELWKKMNAWVIDGFRETYRRFGSEFDVWFLESEFYDKAKPIINEGLGKGIFFRNDKADIVAKLEPLPDKVVLRADGTSIYITNDLALTKHKFENYKIDKAVWVVASEQNLYFQQLFRIFELLGYKWAKDCYHLSYGLVNLPSGRMKSREGTVIDADDLINDVTELAKKEIKKREEMISEKEMQIRANAVALAAIKYYLLKTEPAKDMLFEAEKAISFEGDTGPYLQYTYARAKSILRKSKKKASAGKITDGIDVVKKLSEFPSVIEKSSNEYKPHYLSNYLFELATLFNEFYHAKQVIGSKHEAQMLALVESVSIVLSNGLSLLGIMPLERM